MIGKGMGFIPLPFIPLPLACLPPQLFGFISSPAAQAWSAPFLPLRSRRIATPAR